MARTNEQLLNGELARLITESGIEAAAEQKVGRKRLDVVTTVDGVRVVLEAETGLHKQREAIRDADARLTQGLTSIAFAVCYRDDATVEELGQSDLMWTLRTKPDQVLTSWNTGDVSELAEAVRQSPVEIDDVAAAANLLSQGLDAAVTRLTLTERQRLAVAINLPAITSNKRKDGFVTAAKRGLLVIATAMLFHQRVHSHLPAEAPQGWSHIWPPKSAGACSLNPSTVTQEFDSAWEAILAVDYAPVFESARSALAALPTTNDAGQMLQTLARVVDHVARLVSGMRHDLLGRIFHRVLDTARYDGSFYTSTAAATLLAGLAIREEDCDWSDADAISRLRICDPACGTGTLLMAAAQRISALHQGALQQAGQMSDSDEEALLAETMVEDVLWGYDINITAAHMAASALGMLSPKTQFRNMNIHLAKFGVQGDRAYVGSLEMLHGQLTLEDLPGAVRQIEADDSAGRPEQPPKMDLVIMNPPFTRDSLRYDQFTREEELKLKEHEQLILKGHEFGSAIHLSGTSTPFAVLGDQVLNTETGTLALIMPSVIPTAPSGNGIRQFLAKRFHVETIVSSHDPQRINMSENTNIGEVLIICRRWELDEPKPPTKFYNLAENPATAFDALTLLSQIRRGEQGTFTVQEIESSRIEAGDWNAVNFYSPFLANSTPPPIRTHVLFVA